MPSKNLSFETNARGSLLRGVAQLSRAVKITLGPRGRNVVIDQRSGSPSVTKDGATVAETMELVDPDENLGSQLVREVAKKTGADAGDGTTTATLLAEAIYREGLKRVVSGGNAIGIHRGIQRAAALVADHLGKIASKVDSRDEIRQIATVSANWDKSIGEIISHAIHKVGKDGVVSVEEGRTIDTTIDFVEGMKIDRGYLSPYFATDPGTMEAKLEDAYVLLSEKGIRTLKELFPILEKTARAKKPLLIIAEDVDGEALATLVVNKLRNTIRVCAIKSPGFGERRKSMMEDIAILTGGRFITEDLGITLESLSLDDLGKVKAVEVTRDATVLIGGAGKPENIQSRVQLIRREIEEATADYDKEHLQARLAKLAGGVAIIRVGATTASEMKERKSRLEDAVSATRAAIEEGVVPGGGVALIRCIPMLSSTTFEDADEMMGLEIVKRALEEPARILAMNAGMDGSLVVQEIKRRKAHEGFNAETRAYEDLVKAGVIDPKKVTRTALLNAASIAGLMLTTTCLITETE